jgi:glycosyltransferase involved in cell wall biosynthesis
MNAYVQLAEQLSLPRRWIVVAETPFLPANGGGEREHLGFVQAAAAAGLIAALVVPVDADPAAVRREDDLPAIASLVDPAPMITVPRRRSLRHALNWRLPYVVASRPAPPDLADQVRRAAPDADGIVVFTYKSHELGRVLAEALDLPAVVRFHNLEGVYHRAMAASCRPPRSWAVRLEAERIAADERRLERATWVSGIADISVVDAALRAQRAGVPVVHVPPFALGTRAADAMSEWRPSSAPTVAFLGALDVATNHDAVSWFAREVWPLIRTAVPNCRWQVVGRRPTPAMRELVAATAGAELHPDVADPYVFLSAAGVAVNPAVSGSGVNIKMLEYLNAGVPVVSTRRGAAGLHLAAGVDLQVADSAQNFARAAVDLLNAPDQAARLGASGRRSALRILDVTSGLAQLGTLLGGAIGAGQPVGGAGAVVSVGSVRRPG